MNKQNIGWVGLGNMGNPMVKNLLKAGYQVEVYNRTREKEKEVIDAGATSAQNLKQLSSDNDIIFVMVSDDNAVKQLFTDNEGLLAGNITGKLFINVSTVSPDTSCLINDLCNKQGAEYIEAPVSGSVKPAQDGTLIMLVGGTTRVFDKAKAVLDVLGKIALLLGPVGAGAAAKLAVNYFLALNIQGLAEAVQFAETNGVNPEDMLNVINEGAVGSAITKLKTPSILKNEYPAAFALKHMTKDLRLAKEQNLNSPLSTPLYESFKAAQEQGLGDEDLMSIYKHLESSK